MLMTLWYHWCLSVVILPGIGLVTGELCHSANRCQYNPSSCVLSGPAGLQCSIPNKSDNVINSGTSLIDSAIWPAAPSSLRANVYTSTVLGACFPALNITWKPPQDSSVFTVTGFQLTITFLRQNLNKTNTQLTWSFNVTWPNNSKQLDYVLSEFVFDCPLVDWGDTLYLELYSLPKPNQNIDSRIYLTVDIPQASTDGCCSTSWDPRLAVTYKVTKPSLVEVGFEPLSSPVVSYQLQLVTDSLPVYSINTTAASVTFNNVCPGQYNVTLRAIGTTLQIQRSCSQVPIGVFCLIYVSMSTLTVLDIRGSTPCPTTMPVAQFTTYTPTIELAMSMPDDAVTQIPNAKGLTDRTVDDDTPVVVAVVVCGSLVALFVVALLATLLYYRKRAGTAGDETKSMTKRRPDHHGSTSIEVDGPQATCPGVGCPSSLHATCVCPANLHATCVCPASLHATCVCPSNLGYSLNPRCPCEHRFIIEVGEGTLPSLNPPRDLDSTSMDSTCSTVSYERYLALQNTTRD